MELTEHFTLEEFLESEMADRLGIKNEPNQEQYVSLKALAVNLMEPIRVRFGAPIRIQSGLRVKALNAVTPGSSNTSQHTLGEACDFKVRGVAVHDVARWLAQSDLPWDQLIAEFVVDGQPDKGWTHVSFSRRHRRQVLTASRGAGGKTIYTPGLPAWMMARPAIQLPVVGRAAHSAVPRKP